MTDAKAQVITAAISGSVILVYVGVLVYLARSKSDTNLDRVRQWMRYYRWRAWWDSLPTWRQEALIVRGGGPR
jgi:hypothetical protein